MKVKIGDVIYDAQKEPIMLLLNDEDLNNIKNMPEGYYKYCAYPDEGHDSDDIEEWMKTDEKG